MGVQDRIFAGLARQLRGPHGRYGRLVARRLNRFNETSIRAAVDVLDPAVGSVVADVGFGGGLGLELLAERVGPRGVVHGVDPMPDMVDRAARQQAGLVGDDRLVLHAAAAEELPLADDTLDGVITTNTVYFWPDLGRPLGELARAIRPGGALVLGMADPAYFEGRPFTEHGFHVREVAEVGAALDAAGFQAPEVTPLDIGRTTFHLLRAELPG